MKTTRSQAATVGVCDIGTFTALILIARADRRGLHGLIEERHTIDLLAESGTGSRIGERPLRRVERVLTRFNRLVLHHSCDRAAVVCTAGVRRAGNRAQAVRRFTEVADAPVIVLSARAEAQLSVDGARSAFTRPPLLGLVIDVGGGSTEVTDLKTDRFHGAPIGASSATAIWDRVRRGSVATRTVHIRELIEGALENIPYRISSPAGSIIGTGGTLATLAAINGGLSKFDPAQLQGRQLRSAWIDRAAELFTVMATKEIAALIPFDPRRARVLAAGTILWSQVLKRLCVASVKVSVHGLRWGVASRLAEGGRL